MDRKLFSGAKPVTTDDMNLMKYAAEQSLKASGFPAPVPYNSGHTVVVQDYDRELKDFLNRSFPIGFMCNPVRSTGYPHVWNEQTKMPHNTKAVSPKTGVKQSSEPAKYTLDELDQDYGRDNWKQALPRCYITGIKYSYFDSQMEKHYGAFNEDLLAKDLMSMFDDYHKTIANDFWNGESTGLDTTNEYSYQGILKQISKTVKVNEDQTIADALRYQIAIAAADLTYTGAPNVICMNPITYDLLTREEAEAGKNLFAIQATTAFIGGVEVPAIRTQVGTIPVHLTPFIKIEGDLTAKHTHKIVAINTDLIDRVWLFSDQPKLFSTMDPNNPIANPGLLMDKNLLNFDTYIVHGTQTHNHFILTKEVDATAKKK